MTLKQIKTPFIHVNMPSGYHMSDVKCRHKWFALYVHLPVYITNMWLQAEVFVCMYVGARYTHTTAHV